MADDVPDLNALFGSLNRLLQDLDSQDLSSLQQAAADPDRMKELLSVAGLHLKPEQQQALITMVSSLLKPSKE